jgi:hypothetical protein
VSRLGTSAQTGAKGRVLWPFLAPGPKGWVAVAAGPMVCEAFCWARLEILSGSSYVCRAVLRSAVAGALSDRHDL